MRRFALLVLVSAFVLVVAAGESATAKQSMCALGPGYWCTSSLAAGQCGALEYCRQLQLRSSRPRPAVAAVAAAPALAQRRPPLGDAAACDTCQQVMRTVKQAVLEGKTQEVIGQEVKSQLCAKLGLLTEDCGQLVDMFLPEVLVTVSADIQPQMICTLMGLCNQTDSQRSLDAPAKLIRGPAGSVAAAKKFSNHPVLQLMELFKMSPGQKPLASVTSSLCQSAVAEARRLKRQHASQTAAEGAALLRDAACRVAQSTSGEQAKCVHLTSQYAPVIRHLLSTDLDAAAVCQALGSVDAAAGPPQSSPSHRRQQCLLCEFVARELGRQLDVGGQSRSSPAVIAAALARVCPALPQTVRPQCAVFVRQSGPVATRLLANGLAPGKVCTALGLCELGLLGAAAPRESALAGVSRAKWVQAYANMQQAGSGETDRL